MFPHRRIKISLVLGLFSVLIVLATLTFEISARQANQRNIQTQPIRLGEEWPSPLLERERNHRNKGVVHTSQVSQPQRLAFVIAL